METTVFRSRGARRVALAGALAVVALLGPPCVPTDVGRSAALAQAVEASIDIDTFHQDLSPYGDWVDNPQYGEVWHPTAVAPGWRPYYNDGHWVYSDDDGWTWVSDLPWGWGPFHYGRWAPDPQYGWIWVPGRVWGPAWVTFRQSDQAIGWAPLPPDAGFDPGYGYQGGNIGVSIGVDLWNFVRPEGFLEPRFDRYAYDRREYPRYINETRNITNITVINNRVVNRSVNVTEIERVTHRQVEHVTIADTDRPDRARVNGKQVVIYKPAVVEHGGSATQARTTIVKEDPGQDNKKRPVTAVTKNQPPPNKAGTETTKNKEVKPTPNAPAETLQTQQEKKKQQQQQLETEQAKKKLQQEQQLQSEQTKKKQQLQQEQQQLQTQETKKKQQLQQEQQLQTQETKKKQQLQQEQQLQTQETKKKQQLQQEQQLQTQQTKKKQLQQEQLQSQNKSKKAAPVTPEQQTAPSAGPSNKKSGQQPQLQHKPPPQQGQPVLKKQQKKCPQGAQCSTQND